MCNFNINRVNILGIPQGGGYSFYNYRKGIQKHICYNLKECEDRVLRINIQNSVYYLLGEYNLELGIKKRMKLLLKYYKRTESNEFTSYASNII